MVQGFLQWLDGGGRERLGEFQDCPFTDLGLAQDLVRGTWTVLIGSLRSRELQHCSFSTWSCLSASDCPSTMGEVFLAPGRPFPVG